jgi:hypothetical protein
MNASFAVRLTAQQRATWQALTTPPRIQAFLDSIPYSAEDSNRAPVRVLQDEQAHCLDGGLFAAAALGQIGYPPLIVDLLPDPGADDDHVLALFRRNGCFGAVAKSNFAGLRYREPIYRSLRDLVMSYFEVYFNLRGEKTLRSYTVPLDLSTYDALDWLVDDAAADAIEKRLPQLRRTALLTPAMIAELSPVDRRSFEAGMLGTNAAGLYQPTTTPTPKKEGQK